MLADIDFRQDGKSAPLIIEGRGAQEPGHRWSVGRQSSVRLPVPRLDADCVVAIDMVPWCDAVHLPSQTIMLAINERLMATFEINDHRALAFAVPAGIGAAHDPVLTITHLHASAQRPRTGLAHGGAPLGLMMTSIRVYRLPPSVPPVMRPALAGSVSNATLQRQAENLTKSTVVQLAAMAESLGHNCEFGLVQRALGAEPLGLLRFASLVTHKLADGLVARFAGIGQPGATRIFVSDPPEREFKVHEQLYYVWYSVGKRSAGMTLSDVHCEQCRRLVFLQRKFLDELRAGERLFVMTRAEIMTEPEALAVFCALQVEGPNTLLWTVHGDPARAGEVDRLRPGFLRGHLGSVDKRFYAGMDAWLSVLANAHALALNQSGSASK